MAKTGCLLLQLGTTGLSTGQSESTRRDVPVFLSETGPPRSCEGVWKDPSASFNIRVQSRPMWAGRSRPAVLFRKRRVSPRLDCSLSVSLSFTNLTLSLPTSARPDLTSFVDASVAEVQHASHRGLTESFSRRRGLRAASSPPPQTSYSPPPSRPRRLPPCQTGQPRRPNRDYHRQLADRVDYHSRDRHLCRRE